MSEWNPESVMTLIGASVAAVSAIMTLWFSLSTRRAIETARVANSAQLDAIHTQTNSNLAELKAQLAAALKKIEQLKRANRQKRRR